MRMAYEQKDFRHLIGLEGFPEDLLTLHFTLYAGYVKSVNALADAIAAATPGTPAYAELKRRFGWEFNGMRLHELYFGNMTREATRPTEDAPRFVQKVVSAYGSLDAWAADFRATGAMRGIGWVVCAYDADADRVFNTWINEHDLGCLATAQPLVVMDVFEHAYITAYGLDRAAYIDAFMRAIDYRVVEQRL